jgi:hypothetical protein
MERGPLKECTEGLEPFESPTFVGPHTWETPDEDLHGRDAMIANRRH